MRNPPSVRIIRRPSNSVDRLSTSGAPSLVRASIPASRSTPALLMIPRLAAGTKPYQPGGASNSVNSRRPTSICRMGCWNSLGSAMSNAVMNISRRSRSIHRVESSIFVSNLTNAICKLYRNVTRNASDICKIFSPGVLFNLRTTVVHSPSYIKGSRKGAFGVSGAILFPMPAPPMSSNHIPSR